MSLLSEIIVVNLLPFTKPKILQWPVCGERKGYNQGKEHDIIRLGRKRKVAKQGRKRQQGKDIKN